MALVADRAQRGEDLVFGKQLGDPVGDSQIAAALDDLAAWGGFEVAVGHVVRPAGALGCQHLEPLAGELANTCPAAVKTDAQGHGGHVEE